MRSSSIWAIIMFFSVSHSFKPATWATFLSWKHVCTWSISTFRQSWTCSAYTRVISFVHSRCWISMFGSPCGISEFYATTPEKSRALANGMICSFISFNVIEKQDNCIHLYLIFNRKQESETYIQFTFITRHQIFTNLHRKVI